MGVAVSLCPNLMRERGSADATDVRNSLAGYLIGVSDNYSHIRIIGICFGLQVIARAFGPETIVENPKGW